MVAAADLKSASRQESGGSSPFLGTTLFAPYPVSLADILPTFFQKVCFLTHLPEISSPLVLFQITPCESSNGIIGTVWLYRFQIGSD